MRLAFLLTLALVFTGCSTGEPGDECTEDSDCNNNCCFVNEGYDGAWCSYTGSGCKDSTSDGSCDASYQGPEFDIQVDAFCKAAWNYRCNAGDSSAAEGNCAYYRQFQADNPGIPACPYC